MTFSIIQKSQLEGANRIDAEYYQPEYLELANKISHLNPKIIKEIAIIRSGTTPTDRDDELANGVILLKTTDIRNNILSGDENYYYITPKVAQRMLNTKLEANDILVNIVGATLDVIGRASLIPKNFPESNITQAMALVRIKDNNYLPEFIFTYIMSKYGQFQTDRLARPTGQYNLNLEELGQILVPQISISKQIDIVEIIKNVLDLQKESRDSYQQAENLFLEELELKDFKVPEDLSYIVNYSDTENVDRIDADHFQPKYVSILNKLNSNKLEPLIKNFNISRSKNFEYLDDGEIGVIKTKQLGEKFINLSVEDSTSIEIVNKNNLPIITDLDVVFASMGVGSLGKTNIYYGFEANDKQFTIDSTLRIFSQLPGGKVLPEVLMVYLNSNIGQELIYKYVVGSSGIISIYENYLEDFPIPILSKESQTRIADLVKKSHEARKKSKELLEEAKKMVEEMIEKGGEN